MALTRHKVTLAVLVDDERLAAHLAEGGVYGPRSRNVGEWEALDYFLAADKGIIMADHAMVDWYDGEVRDG